MDDEQKEREKRREILKGLPVVREQVKKALHEAEGHALEFRELHIDYMINTAKLAHEVLEQLEKEEEKDKKRVHEINLRYLLKVISTAAWRLGVDGLTEEGGLKYDGAKYETKLKGRYSSTKARDIRDEKTDRAQSAMYEAGLRSEHTVPRIEFARWLILNVQSSLEGDKDKLRERIMKLCQVAVIHKDEDRAISKDDQSQMPDGWWPLSWEEKESRLQIRYKEFQVMAWPP